MKFFGLYILVICISIGCKNKKKEPADNSNYFPVLSFLQSEVKKIDTSLFSITKVVTVNDVSDSTPIPREQVRGLAQEFLNIPDLRSEEGKWYNEIHVTDDNANTGSWTYNNEENDVRKIQVFFVKTGLNFENTVTTVYIEKEQEKGDSLVQKRLLWDSVDDYFQVRTITSKKNSPDKIENLRVVWQDFQSN